ALEILPGAVEPVGLVWPVILACGELLLELGPPVGLEPLDLLHRDQTLADEALRIEFQRRLVRADAGVHQRLGEARLVAFVVAEAAIAEHVYDDRFGEPLAELGRDL